MANLQWLDGTLASIFTTALDSLADGARVVSGILHNDGGLDFYADFEFAVAYTTSAPAAGTKVADVYLLPTVDGTNYPEGSTSVSAQELLLVGSFVSRNGSTSTLEYLVVPGISLPPRNFKIQLVNRSGKTYKSSGNTLKYTPYKIQVV